MKSFKSPIFTAPENCAMQDDQALAWVLLLLLKCWWVQQVSSVAAVWETPTNQLLSKI